jgi:uncharacterized membrane protein YgcG
VCCVSLLLGRIDSSRKTLGFCFRLKFRFGRRVRSRLPRVQNLLPSPTPPVRTFAPVRFPIPGSGVQLRVRSIIIIEKTISMPRRIRHIVTGGPVQVRRMDVRGEVGCWLLGRVNMAVVLDHIHRRILLEVDSFEASYHHGLVSCPRNPPCGKGVANLGARGRTCPHGGHVHHQQGASGGDSHARPLGHERWGVLSNRRDR